MQILRKETLEFAIIDPRKKPGEEGQYVRYPGQYPDLRAILNQARAQGMEIRQYVENIAAGSGGVVPLKHVIVEVPPMHVQPFHTHTNADEINLVTSGEVYFIESDTLTERDVESFREHGVHLRAGDAVVSTLGKRHTLANLSNAYAHTIGTISAARSVPGFQPDWKR